MNFREYKEHKEGKYIIRVWDDGDKIWLINGKYHREDGPAVEHSSGEKGWWLDDNYYHEGEWKNEMRKRKLEVLGL